MKTLLRRFFVFIIGVFCFAPFVFAGGMQEGAFTVQAGFTVIFDTGLAASTLKTETVTITGYGTAPLNGDRQQALTTAKAGARTQLALQAAGTRFSYRTEENEILFTARSSADVSGARTVKTEELTAPDGRKLLFTTATADHQVQLPPKQNLFTTTLRKSGDSIDSILRSIMKEAVRQAVKKKGESETPVIGTIFITHIDVK